jgi:hypothetical protein
MIRSTLASAAALALALLTPAGAHAWDDDAVLYPEGATVLGKTYREWSARYAQWELEIPRGQHPAIDPSRPRNCEVVEGMVMLGASGTGPEGCAVPEDTPLMSMPVGWECSEAEGDGDTFRELRRCAAGPNGWQSLFGPDGIINGFRLTIDGQRIPHRGDRWQFVTTPTVADLPENNIIEFWRGGEVDYPAQTTKQMSAVVSHILRPLDEGWHRIRFVVDYREEEDFAIVWRVNVVDDNDKAAQ